MDQKFLIVANLKLNPLPKYDFAVPENLEIAIAPQFNDISLIFSGFTRAAQDIGESAQKLKDLGVKYCLVGHSYYRNNFGETNEIAQQKIKQLKSVNIVPILCARNLDEIPKQVRDDTYIMYEPERAISSNGQYHPETPENINKVLDTFPKNTRFLYGGSVNEENCKLLIVNCKLVSGFVIGHASLDPFTFGQIIDSVSKLQ